MLPFPPPRSAERIALQLRDKDVLSWKSQGIVTVKRLVYMLKYHLGLPRVLSAAWRKAPFHRWLQRQKGDGGMSDNFRKKVSSGA